MIIYDKLGINNYTLDLLPDENCNGFIYILTNVFTNKYTIFYTLGNYTGRTFYFEVELVDDIIDVDITNGIIYLNEDGQYFYNVYEVAVDAVIDITYLNNFLSNKINELEFIKSDLCALRTGRLLVKMEDLLTQ